MDGTIFSQIQNLFEIGVCLAVTKYMHACTFILKFLLSMFLKPKTHTSINCVLSGTAHCLSIVLVTK